MFTSTHTENHFEVAQKVFLTLLENEVLKQFVSKQWYSPKLGRFCRIAMLKAPVISAVMKAPARTNAKNAQ